MKSKIDAAMQRAGEFAAGQFNDVKQYMLSLGIDKPIHIGETGWATVSNGYYEQVALKQQMSTKQKSIMTIYESGQRKRRELFLFRSFR